MRRRPTAPRRTGSARVIRRRGALLFEVLLSLALFVGAGAFALGSVRTVLTALDRAERRAFVVDLARARMAELEAGISSLADLEEDEAGIDRVGSIDLYDGIGVVDDDDRGWTVELTTELTEFPGLTLVVLTVREEDARDAAGLAGDADAGPAPISYTLRQLVALREERRDEYEEDELIRGLPRDAGDADASGEGGP